LTRNHQQESDVKELVLNMCPTCGVNRRCQCVGTADVLDLPTMNFTKDELKPLANESAATAQSGPATRRTHRDPAEQDDSPLVPPSMYFPPV
jgi:hypothetical protein